MAPARTALLAALAVVLAGCGSLPAPGTGAATPTLTPVPVPETPGNERPAGSGTLAPGLTREGVSSPFALADTHRATLRDTAYTYVRTTTITDENGTLRSVRRSLRVAPGGEPYRLVLTSDSAERYPVSSLGSPIELYHSGGLTVFRLVQESTVFYERRTDRLGGPITDTTGHDRIAGLLAGFAFRVEPRPAGATASGDGRNRTGLETGTGRGAVPANGTAVYRLTATELYNPGVLGVPALLAEPRNVSATVRVGVEGRVRQYRVAYAATFDDRRVEVVRTGRFVRVGTTEVARPPWYDEALNATGTTAAGDPEATDPG